MWILYIKTEKISREKAEKHQKYEFLLQPVEGQSHFIDFYKKGDEKSSFLMYINCDKT